MQAQATSFVMQYRPKPTKYKAELKEMGVSFGAVAQYLGFSYPYTLGLLGGSHRMTPEVEWKIQDLIRNLKKEVVNN